MIKNQPHMPVRSCGHHRINGLQRLGRLTVKSAEQGITEQGAGISHGEGGRALDGATNGRK